MLNRFIAAAGAVSLLASASPAFALSLDAYSSTSTSASVTIDRDALKEEMKTSVRNIRTYARQTGDELKNAIRASRRGKNVELNVNANVNATCVKGELTQRETALVTAMTTYMDSWKAALLKRQASLEAAWSLTVTADRNVAVKAAWSVYVSDMKKARDVFKDAKKTAWKSFQTDIKANCNASADIDANGQVMDEE